VTPSPLNSPLDLHSVPETSRAQF